jgi:hypothetical protein
MISIFAAEERTCLSGMFLVLVRVDRAKAACGNWAASLAVCLQSRSGLLHCICTSSYKDKAKGRRVNEDRFRCPLKKVFAPVDAGSYFTILVKVIRCALLHHRYYTERGSCLVCSAYMFL